MDTCELCGEPVVSRYENGIVMHVGDRERMGRYSDDYATWRKAMATPPPKVHHYQTEFRDGPLAGTIKHSLTLEKRLTVEVDGVTYTYEHACIPHSVYLLVR